MNFGDRLKELRIEKRLKQDELSKYFNVSRQSISKYETNERFPDKESLIKLSRFFNVSIDYLLGVTDIKEPLEEIIKKGQVTVKPPSDIEKLYESLPAEEKKQFKDFGEFLKCKSGMNGKQMEDCSTLDTIEVKKKNAN